MVEKTSLDCNTHLPLLFLILYQYWQFHSFFSFCIYWVYSPGLSVSSNIQKEVLQNCWFMPFRKAHTGETESVFLSASCQPSRCLHFPKGRRTSEAEQSFFFNSCRILKDKDKDKGTPHLGGKTSFFQLLQNLVSAAPVSNPGSDETEYLGNWIFSSTNTGLFSS